LLGVARDEAFTVPFELTLSVNDDTKHQVYRVTLRVECEPQ
jgi:hypothetical protein